MRSEIDSLVARGYGLTPGEVEFVFTENGINPAYRERVMAAFEAM